MVNILLKVKVKDPHTTFKGYPKGTTEEPVNFLVPLKAGYLRLYSCPDDKKQCSVSLDF